VIGGLAFAAVLAHLALGAGAHRTATRKLVIIDAVEGEPGSVPPLRAEAERVLGTRLGIELVADARTDEERRALLKDCGSDPGCLCSGLRDGGADLALVLSVDLSLAPPPVLAELLEVGPRKLLAKAVWSSDPDGPGLLSEIRSEIGRLLEQAGHPRGARIAVDVAPAEATVVVEPEGMVLPHGAERAAVLAPGRYVLRAAAEGFDERTLELVVTAGEERSVTIALEPSGSVFGSPWFWAGFAAAALAGGAVGAFALARGSGRSRAVVCEVRDLGSCP
jgi:hypothetical protein